MKAPFPYFGGKSTITKYVWQALGDCAHYIEPFCGSCAVLLLRPGYDAQKYTETVNDADGHIANIWRALQADPDEVAKRCDWPVNHCCLIARKKRLNLETETLLERLCADETYFDPLLAGYYIWAASCWIGHGLIRPTQIPHMGDKGRGVHAKGQRPHLGTKGMGVHAKGKRPHLGTKGMGVHAKNVNIYEWFRQLSERLRYVRVVCGDWKRVCGGDWQDASWPTVGMFFDPPYSLAANRDPGIYAIDSLTVADDVREWCLARGDRKNYRIVLAGYYEEHDSLLNHGWTVRKWTAQGGYSNTSTKNKNSNQNRHREALFFSPHCVNKEVPKQSKLF